MFLKIPDILDKEEIAFLRRAATEAVFIDGKVTNPGSSVKHNTQLRYEDRLFAETSKVLNGALQRSEAFRDFALPRYLAPPMLTGYGEGKYYGLHSDAAFMPIAGRPLRSDLSCTIWVSDPDGYEGGELKVVMGSHTAAFKEAAGTALVYPSNMLHEVVPVTSGQRLVGLTFIESRISRVDLRTLMFELNEVAATEGLKMSREGFAHLQHVQSCLMRLWGDPG